MQYKKLCLASWILSACLVIVTAWALSASDSKPYSSEPSGLYGIWRCDGCGAGYGLVFDGGGVGVVMNPQRILMPFEWYIQNGKLYLDYTHWEDEVEMAESADFSLTEDGDRLTLPDTDLAEGVNDFVRMNVQKDFN